MNKSDFWKYCGVQGILALLLIAAVVGLAVASQPIPETLATLAAAAAAFYFGSKGPALALAVEDHALAFTKTGRGYRRDLSRAVQLLDALLREFPKDLDSNAKEAVIEFLTEWQS